MQEERGQPAKNPPVSEGVPRLGMELPSCNSCSLSPACLRGQSGGEGALGEGNFVISKLNLRSRAEMSQKGAGKMAHSPEDLGLKPSHLWNVGECLNPQCWMGAGWVELKNRLPSISLEPRPGQSAQSANLSKQKRQRTT